MRLDMIVCADFLDSAPAVADSSINLIISDWPYYKMKVLDWDRQWSTPEEYLGWIGLVCEQYRRILTPNGSLYAFASPEMAARVEVKIREYFDVLNFIRWEKKEGWHKKAVPEALRSYLSPWEAVIFAEHYGADSAAKGESGYGAKCDELRGFVFEPLRTYFEDEKKQLDLTNKQVNEILGTAVTGSGMAGHYFKPSGLVQWSLPTKEFYERLQSNTNGFKRSYEDLRAEYEDLRRPFDVTAQDQYTDVWDFPTVKHYPGKHPCEKPPEMMEHIIKVSSRPGDVVGDFFCGSGGALAMAHKMGRRYTGSDLLPKWAKRANERIAKARLEMVQLEFDIND